MPIALKSDLTPSMLSLWPGEVRHCSNVPWAVEFPAAIFSPTPAGIVRQLYPWSVMFWSNVVLAPPAMVGGAVWLK
ncbi:MAG: hypothetical protein QOF73_3078 [Thermomicrobiales bacterium]|nr:hypothetical protein [Thermomicrobiales bacterium]